MAINRINETDLQGKLVSQLSNRPTDPRSAGGDGMTAGEVKARQDALGLLLKERFNALVDALVADPAVDTDALANYIKVYLGDPAEDDPLSLADALAALVTEIAKKYEKPEGGIPATDLAEAVTTAIDGKYVKPGTGIPATDLETSVQTSLGKADTAYQKPSGGIPTDDLAEAIRTILTNAVSQSEFAPVKALAENADKVLTAANYEAVATMLNAAAKTDYKVGQKILIGAGRVPDVWIYFVHDAAVSYTFTTNLAFQTALESNTLQIGYYALRPLEAKTNLEGYATETYVGNAISGNIDATLSTTGKSADAKAVGDAIDALIDALVDGVMAVAEATYAESATYAQQAGIASQINTDREIEDADTACPPVVFGTVGGNAEVQSGLMPFLDLRGHTIKWNQLVQNGNFDGTNNWNTQSATFSASDNVASFTASAQYGKIKQYRDLQNGHKYLLKISIKLTTATTSVLAMFSAGSEYHYKATQATTTWQDVTIIASAGQSGSFTYCIRDDRASDWDAIQVKNAQLFDLTEIYNAGNEPSTVAEFARDFPMPYYAYNPGTLLSSKSSSVDIIKRNQWDEEWLKGAWVSGVYVDSADGVASKNAIMVLPNTTYYSTTYIYVCEYDGNGTFIQRTSTDHLFTTTAQTRYIQFNTQSSYGNIYNNDICIYINWDTPGLPYVPYSKQTITLPNIELRSVADVYDVAYQTGGGKRRAGTYTFNGAESWTKGETLTPAGLHRYYFGISGMKSGAAMAGMCSKFETFDYTWTDATTDGVVFGMSNAYLYFLSTADLTVSEVQAIFNSSVTIVFPLATETDITLEENPGWTEYAEIDNFGTVKFNQDPAQTPQVPQAYFVRYTVNLVEFLDSLFVHCGGDVSKLALVE